MESIANTNQEVVTTGSSKKSAGEKKFKSMLTVDDLRARWKK